MIVRLSPFSANDVETLISWVDKPGASDLWAARTYLYPVSRKTVLKHLEKTRKKPIELGVYKILAPDGGMAGQVELDKFDHAAGAALVTRLFVTPKYRNRGIARQAMELLLKHCFSGLRLNRVGIMVFEHNVNALRLYENLGFKREGFIRENAVLSGKRYGSYILSMLKAEYKERNKTGSGRKNVPFRRSWPETNTEVVP